MTRLGARRDGEHESPDITKVLQHYGVSTGRAMVSCPFHVDKTPSCSVDYGRNLWNCHSCNRHGSSWGLIMEMEGIDFDGAKAFAAANGLGAGDVGGERNGLSKKSLIQPRRNGLSSGSRSKPGGGGFIPSWYRR